MARTRKNIGAIRAARVKAKAQPAPQNPQVPQAAPGPQGPRGLPIQQQDIADEVMAAYNQRKGKKPKTPPAQVQQAALLPQRRPRPVYRYTPTTEV